MRRIQIILVWIVIYNLVACMPSTSSVSEGMTQPVVTTIVSKPVVSQNTVQATSTPFSIIQSVTSSQLTLTVQPEDEPRLWNEIQEDKLEDYVVHELAGSETKHRYVILVNAQDFRAPLPTTKEVIQKCWLYQNSSLNDCWVDDFLSSFNGESTTSWKSSYVFFAVITVTAEFDQATVRLDEIFGPRASKGMLYALIKVNGDWQIESSKLLWSS